MVGEPLVSVVVIFLDAERFLREALDSVFAQSFRNWELLLVDDGSTDASTAIAKRCAADHPGRVRYLEHPSHENRGMSASRNLGIRESRGEYVALLDADDAWLPRRLEEQVAILQAHPDVAMVFGKVTLPTNFKAARFESQEHTDLLRRLEADVDAVRFPAPEGPLELPVKLRVSESIFVPLAKWSMLLAGNYRCITEDGMRTAKEAVHSDPALSKSVYDFVFDLCVRIGACPADLVPFEKYAAAAESLTRPASAARALQNGVPYIERADKLVQLCARQFGLSHPEVDRIVALVDRRLAANREKR